MGRAFLVWAAAVLTLLLAGQQPATSQSAADPAVDLVRTRVFLTTTASAIDMAVEGVTLANAVFTQRGGPGSVRAVVDHNTIHFTRNPDRAAIDFQIDMILADVRPSGTVGWTLASESPASSRLDIRNANTGESRVDSFDLDGASGRFTTRADLLRNGGPLGAVPAVDSHLVVAFFYPWWDRTSWSTSPLFLDRPRTPYSTDDPADLARVMTEAKSTGIDALVVSWAGKDFNGAID